MELITERNKEIERELKLHINQQLFDKGHITEDMYNKAKEMIYKYCNSQCQVI